MDARTATSDEVIAQVLRRNAFYRKQYFLALSAFLLSVIVLLVLLGVLVFLQRNPTQPVYFATDPVGRLLPSVPLDQPNMSLDDVSDWAVEAVQSTYSYDYVNYRQQQQGSQKYFTSYGWANYVTALVASNNLVALKERKMVVIASVIDKPKLLKQGLLGEAYAWKFEMPLLVTYWLPPYDEQSKFSNPLTVSITINRQPLLQSYRGLGVVQMIGTITTAHANQQPQELTAPTAR